MRGREGDDFPLAGPWDCEFPSGRAAFFEHFLSTGMRVLSTFDLKSEPARSVFADRHVGFKVSDSKTRRKVTTFWTNLEPNDNF